MIWLLIAGVALLLTYELLALTRHKVTISRLVWDASAKYPILPFAFGLLMGHFFWRMC